MTKQGPSHAPTTIRFRTGIGAGKYSLRLSALPENARESRVFLSDRESSARSTAAPVMMDSLVGIADDRVDARDPAFPLPESRRER
jgi:hypothetical protein